MRFGGVHLPLQQLLSAVLLTSIRGRRSVDDQLAGTGWAWLTKTKPSIEGAAMRAKLVFAAVLLLVAAAVVPAAAQANNFGGHWLGGCCFQGSRSDITTPCCDFTLSFGTFGIMRADTEDPSNAALIQIGYAQTNAVLIDSVCRADSIQYFWEYLHSFTGLYTCSTSWGAPGYGVTHRYSTWRATTTPSDTLWKAGVDGVTKVSQDIGISNGSEVIAGGEIGGGGNTGSGHLYGCFGCASGGTPWQWSQTAGGAGWITIGSECSPLNSDGRWTIGLCPTPFTVTHPYP
jgi:hypothetical protein